MIYPYMLTDSKHKDKHLRLVMTLIALRCAWQSRSLNISCERSDIQTKGQTKGLTDATKYIISQLHCR